MKTIARYLLMIFQFALFLLIQMYLWISITPDFCDNNILGASCLESKDFSLIKGWIFVILLAGLSLGLLFLVYYLQDKYLFKSQNGKKG